MLVHGKNVAKEILKNNIKINKVFLSNNFNDKDILFNIDKRNLKINYIDKNKLDKMCNHSNSQGIVLDIEEYTYKTMEEVKNDKDASLIVILDSLEDANNFGAIIRTSECAGVDYIIIPKKRSIEINSAVYKTSAGALSNVKIVQVSNLVNAIKVLKTLGFWIYGSDAKGKDYKKVEYSSKACLVIGSEGRGMKHIVSSSCDEIISIPMHGKINSLNASVSAGILIYEIINSRGNI